MVNNYEIGITDLDSSEYRRLTKNRYFDGNPVWSPDGSRIAFLSNRPPHKDLDNDEYQGPVDLYVMDPDGSDALRLASGVIGLDAEAWSPDGKSLTFLGYEQQESHVFAVGSDGSNLNRLTKATWPPAWSPGR